MERAVVLFVVADTCEGIQYVLRKEDTVTVKLRFLLFFGSIQCTTYQDYVQGGRIAGNSHHRSS
jgi:hypothetical protein